MFSFTCWYFYNEMVFYIFKKCFAYKQQSPEMLIITGDCYFVPFI